MDGESGRGVAGFTPRSYMYLALALAALVEAGRQVLLSQLIADIRGAATEAAIAVGDDLVELRALSAALRHLVGLGVLEETEGTVAALGHGGSGEALITVDTELLGLMMTRTRAGAPRQHDAPTREPGVIGLSAGVGARRRIVEDPVVLYADMPAAEAEYLRHYQRREGYWLDRYFGLQADLVLYPFRPTSWRPFLVGLAPARSARPGVPSRPQRPPQRLDRCELRQSLLPCSSRHPTDRVSPAAWSAREPG